MLFRSKCYKNRTIGIFFFIFASDFILLIPKFASGLSDLPTRQPFPELIPRIDLLSMKTLFKLVFIILCAACVTVLPACSRGGKTYRIGVSQCSADDWRSKMNEEMEREIMFHPDAELEIRSADDSNEKQIADIQYFLDNGFDIIIAAPNEADAIRSEEHTSELQSR